MSVLTSHAVRQLALQVIASTQETPIKKVEGIVEDFAFSPERIEQSKDKIREMLAELPDQFQKGLGGGWSFLNACHDRNGEQWTGLHKDMELLVCMGIAAGLAEWQMREMQDALPGGLPYCWVDGGRT